MYTILYIANTWNLGTKRGTEPGTVGWVRTQHQARSFEAKLLNQDRMTAELHTYKNREGGLVVLYSNDDAEACHVSQSFEPCCCT